MRRPPPLTARIFALLTLAAAVLAASGGCGDSDTVPACSPTSACAAGEWCVYPDGRCGKGSPIGSCTPVADLVSCAASQVCGCDGKIYPSTCAAAAAGVDSTEPTSCTAPAGTFGCGGTYCAAATQLCAQQQALTPNSVCQTSVTCASLPAACAAAPTCACLAANGFPGTCAGDATSGFSVNAPSGC